MLSEEEKKLRNELEGKIWKYDIAIRQLTEEKCNRKDLRKEAEEELKRLEIKEKLLRYANCNHKWNRINFQTSCLFNWCKIYRYDHYEFRDLHTHEKCTLCGLVKGEPIYPE